MIALLAGCLPAAGAVAVTPSTLFSATNPAEFRESLGSVESASTMRVLLILPSRDEAGAEAFVQGVSNPASPLFGRYLKPAQFAARFGAKAEDVAAVVAWAQANGLRVGTVSAAGNALAVSGSAATMQRLFATRLVNFRTRSGKIGFTPTIAPTLPAALAGKVSGVIGLTNTRRIPTQSMKADAQALSMLSTREPLGGRPLGGGTGELGGFSPADLQGIYDLPPPLTTAAPQTVALFEQGGFRPGDVDVFKQHYKLPNIPVIAKGVNGSGTGDVPGVDSEAVLDIDMVIGVNPHVARVLVYEDADDDFPVAVLDALTAMADDDTAQTISISYGFDEALTDTAAETALKTVTIQLAAQGQTVFASTGDSGAYGDEPPNYNVSFPSTDPYITAVGGTTLFSSNGQYGDEEAWNLLRSNYGATGGGVSTVFSIPAWQAPEIALLRGLNGGSAKMRNVPDVAAVGNPLTGVSIYLQNSGGWAVYGGTSVASPVWAAFSSVLNQARVGAGLPAIGFFNPRLYKLSYESVAGGLDVQDGSNGFPHEFPKTPGYMAGFLLDNCTGFGSIDVNTFLASMLTINFTNVGLPGVARGIAVTPGSRSVKVAWNPATKALGYYVVVQSGNSSQVAGSAVATGKSITIGGLLPKSSYVVTVIAENSAGAVQANAVAFSTTK